MVGAFRVDGGCKAQDETPRLRAVSQDVTRDTRAGKARDGLRLFRLTRTAAWIPLRAEVPDAIVEDDPTE